jgi:hypothetical protein
MPKRSGCTKQLNKRKYLNLLKKEILKDILHQSGLTKTEKLLLCLGVNPSTPKTITEIKQIGRSAGLADIKSWNVSSFLTSSGGKAVHTGSGWELTKSGVELIQKLTGSLAATHPPPVASSLRDHLKQIKDQQATAFVEEAIACFESKLYRAAVVLSWIGAISVLYEWVVNNKLAAFNMEAKRRNPKWKDANTKDDLALMKEWDFLQILEAISVVGKSVKQELEKCLELRNGCGHPNSLKIGEHYVSAHIEILIMNVCSQFTT